MIFNPVHFANSVERIQYLVSIFSRHKVYWSFFDEIHNRNDCEESWYYVEQQKSYFPVFERVEGEAVHHYSYTISYRKGVNVCNSVLLCYHLSGVAVSVLISILNARECYKYPYCQNCEISWQKN